MRAFSQVDVCTDEFLSGNPVAVVPAAYVAAQGTKLHRRGRVRVEQSDGGIWAGGGTVVGITGHVAL